MHVWYKKYLRELCPIENYAIKEHFFRLRDLIILHIYVPLLLFPVNMVATKNLSNVSFFHMSVMYINICKRETQITPLRNIRDV